LLNSIDAKLDLSRIAVDAKTNTQRLLDTELVFIKQQLSKNSTEKESLIASQISFAFRQLRISPSPTGNFSA
jgi:hypothetical protein